MFDNYIDDATEVGARVYTGTADGRQWLIISDEVTKRSSRQWGSGFPGCMPSAKHCALLLCFCWCLLQLARNTFMMPSYCAVGCMTRSGESKQLFLLPTGTRHAKRQKEWLCRIARIGFKPTLNSTFCEEISMSIYAQPLGCWNVIRVEQHRF